MSEVRFDDKVVIVTGAGNGLGRSHAKLFASRGAKVVVNDLGGGRHGDGKGSEAADQVVAEIREAGGEAVANYDSVVDGDKIVQTAMDTYGRLDVVVNNAGILRDTSFHKMTDQDWDLIYQVHVLGAYKIMQAAWPIMREQKYGRVIMTVSAAGIYGNRGQANYSMAKLGLHGFGQTLAIEGARSNIRVNSIAPIAGSRLTETIMPKKALTALAPEAISPIVAWLCHEDCEETGQLYELGAGFFSKLRWQRSQGITYRVGRDISPESLRDRWDELTQFDEGVVYPETIQESMGPVMANISAGPSKGGNDIVDVDLALGYEYPEVKTSYDARDVALYALGIGAAKDPLDDNQLRYVFERHGKGMVPFPSYAVIPSFDAAMYSAKNGQQAPGLNYGFDRLLHGEQKTEVKYPLPRKAKLRHKQRIKDIFDKGKGALVVTETITLDEDGNELCRNESSAFIRGAGGYGGDRGSSDPVNVPPERAPDAVVEEKTAENQALLYRLSGDWNPLHADPRFAKAMNFDKPILHGLCTYGFAARHVLETFAPEGDSRFFKNLAVRFSGSVFPGETLVTEMWKESDQRIVFQVKVKERDDAVVISNAALELYEQIPERPAKPKAAAAGAGANAEPAVADYVHAIGDAIAAKPSAVAKIGKVFQFAVTEPDEVWTVDLKTTGQVSQGETAKPDTTFHLKGADFMAMVRGEKDAMQLFTGGALKIKGDMMASQKLGPVLAKVDLANVEKHMQARAGGGDAGAAPASSGPSVSDVMRAIGLYAADNAGVKKVGKVFQFAISEPDELWTLDLPNQKVEPGETTKPDTTFKLKGEDFMAMVRGEKDAMKLYMGGDLKIKGDAMASQSLGPILAKIDDALIQKAMAERPAQSAEVTAAPKANGRAPFAEKIIAALEGKLGKKGDGSRVLQFRVKDPDCAFVVDWTSTPPSVKPGEREGASATITIDDETLEALAKDPKSAQSLFQHGKLKVDGDLSAAHDLGFLAHGIS